MTIRFNSSWKKMIAGLILLLTIDSFAWAAPPSEAGKSQETGAPGAARPPVDLESELFQGLNQLPAPGIPSPGKTGEPGGEGNPRAAGSRGEDLGERSEDDSWLRIGASMKDVQRRLAAGNLGRETQQLQKIISQELGEMMKQVQQQQQAPALRPGGGAASGVANGEQERQPSGDKADPDGSETIEGNTGGEAGDGETATTMKELWGYLPARIQAQLRGAGTDQFLPKYERLLEQFYRRLAEQAGESQ